MSMTPNRPPCQPATGTYFVRPHWQTSPGADDSSDGFYAAVSVATGERIHEADDIGLLVAHMTAAHPHLALVENLATANWRSCLRTVPVDGRL